MEVVILYTDSQDVPLLPFLFPQLCILHCQTLMMMMMMMMTAHLSLDVSHALVVQFGRRAHLENEPRAHIIVHVEYDGERQQEQTHEDPSLVDDHVVETFDSDPQKEHDGQSGQVQQGVHLVSGPLGPGTHTETMSH